MILERNDLRLYDRMILAINVNLLGYCCHLRTLDFDLPPSGVICALYFASHSLAANQNLRVSNDNSALKMNIIVCCSLNGLTQAKNLRRCV